MNQFLKIVANTYVDVSGSVFLRKTCQGFEMSSDRYRRGFKIFSSIKEATEFLNNEDSFYNFDDIEFLTSAYNFEHVKDDMWKVKVDDTLFIMKLEPNCIILNTITGDTSDVTEYRDFDELLKNLDSYFQEKILSCSFLVDSSKRADYISCASNSRELAKNLVRVKSSNIWAYAIDVKDKKSKTGDLIVQFKGKLGGPDDIYMYYDVPVKVWREWLTAPSKGHFFWLNIRNNFLYRKLTGDKKTHLKNGLN